MSFLNFSNIYLECGSKQTIDKSPKIFNFAGSREKLILGFLIFTIFVLFLNLRILSKYFSFNGLQISQIIQTSKI
jgi:hypothetical protein